MKKIYKVVNNTGGNITWGTILISNGSFYTIVPDDILDASAIIADTNQYATLLDPIQAGTIEVQLNDVPLSTSDAEEWFNDYRNSDGQNVILYDSQHHQIELDDPHDVTPAQVGNTTAQWNADQIQGTDIFASITPTDGQVLTWDATNTRWDAADAVVATSFDWIDFNPQDPLPTYQEGRFFYNAAEKSMQVYGDIDNALQNVMNQAQIARGKNETGALISKGSVVDFHSIETGGAGLNIHLPLADGTNLGNENWALAIATEDIADGDYGTCAFFGTIYGMNTAGLIPGEPTYLSNTVPGGLTNTRPNYPGESHLMGTAIVADATNGVFVAYFKDDNYDYEFDGCILERQDTSVIVEGSEIYMDVKNTEGSSRDLPIQLGGSTYSLNTSTGPGVNGSARVQLLQGTNSVPQAQIVYIDLTGGVPTLKTTAGYPPVPFAIVAFVTVLDYTNTQANGPLLHRRITSSKAHGSRGRIGYFTERFSVVPVQYWSGLTPSAVISGGGDTLDLSVIEGIVYQTHRQTFPSLSVVGNGIFVANASGLGTLTAYQKLNDLQDINEDAAGNPLSNSRYHLNVWGAINKSTSECKLFVNLPDSSYGGSDSQAYYDYDGTAVYSVPNDMQTVAFLIARIPLDRSGGDLVSFINPVGQPEIIPLLGTPVGVTSGGSGGTGAFIPSLSQVLSVGNTTGNQAILDLPEVVGTNTNNVIDLQSGISVSSDTDFAVNINASGRMYVNSSSETLPSTSIPDIEIGGNRQITTKEWVLSKVATPTLQLVTDEGATTTNAISVSPIATGAGLSVNVDNGTVSNNTTFIGADTLGNPGIWFDAVGNEVGITPSTVLVGGNTSLIVTSDLLSGTSYLAPVNTNDYAMKGYVDAEVAAVTLQVVTDAGATTTNKVDFQASGTAISILNNSWIADSLQNGTGNLYITNDMNPGLSNNGSLIGILGDTIDIKAGGQVDFGSLLMSPTASQLRRTSSTGDDAYLSLENTQSVLYFGLNKLDINATKSIFNTRTAGLDPTDDNDYVTKLWGETNLGGGITEAPEDGNTYGRQDATWVQVTPSTVGNTTAQWNADQLQGKVITGATPTDTQVLTFNSALNGGQGAWEPQTPTSGGSNPTYSAEYSSIGALSGQFVVRRDTDSSYNMGFTIPVNSNITGVLIETGISTASQATDVTIRLSSYTTPNGVQYAVGNGTTLSSDSVLSIGAAAGAEYYRAEYIDKSSSPIVITAGDMLFVDANLNFWNITDLHVTVFYEES